MLTRLTLRLAPKGLLPSLPPSLPPPEERSSSRLPPGLDAVGGPHAFLLELAWELPSEVGAGVGVGVGSANLQSESWG